MAYTNGSGTYHDRRTCRRLHRSGRRVRTVNDTTDRDACPVCVKTDADTDTDATDDRTDAERDIAGMIDMGVCPWCESEYENVAAHASQVHPDEWDAYKAAA